MTDPRFISLEDAAKAYGVGRETMRHLVTDGFFPFARKAGGRYIIERAPFESHLADPRATWTPEPAPARSPYIRDVSRRAS